MGIKKPRRATVFNRTERPSLQGDTPLLSVKWGPRTVPDAPRVTRGTDGTDGNGAMFLRAEFPEVTRSGSIFILDISFLLTVPALTNPFADALLLKLGPRPNVTSAMGYAKRLRNGFFAFLTETSRENIGLADISTPLVNGFIQWLNQTNGREARWAENSRAMLYLAAVNHLKSLGRDARWTAQMVPSLSLAPNPWPGRTRRTRVVEVINRDLMTRIRLACIKEVDATMHSFNATSKLVATHLIDLPPIEEYRRGSLSGLEVGVVLAHLERCSGGGVLPRRENLPVKLRSAVMMAGLRLADDVAPLFYPTPRALVPFVLLMGMALSYNAETIRNANCADFSSSNFLGEFLVMGSDGAGPEEKLSFDSAAFKGRSGRAQPVFTPVDEASDNPAVLFDFLKRWTHRLRSLAKPEVADRLFLYATARSKFGISSFAGIDGTANAENWRTCLENFRRQHSLEHFTLQMIRPTVFDVAFEAFDGDPKAVQLQANHKYAATTVESYTSDAERQRQYQRLGTIVEMRTRWRESKGLLDSRDRAHSDDLACATPGWGCLDTYDSPFTQKGKMCSAYGLCPICPLGCLDLGSPTAFAHATNLLDAVNRAQGSTSPENWLERLGPIKSALMNHWIPSFAVEVVAEARAINLVPMPKPE